MNLYPEGQNQSYHAPSYNSIEYYDDSTSSWIQIGDSITYDIGWGETPRWVTITSPNLIKFKKFRIKSISGMYQGSYGSPIFRENSMEEKLIKDN